MGQTQANPFEQELCSYTILEQNEKECTSVLRNPESTQTVLLRKFTCFDLEQYENCLEEYRRCENLDCAYMQKLISTEDIILEFEGVVTKPTCFVIHEIYSIWEHHMKSLSDLIDERRSTNNYLSKEEYVKIIEGCFEAFAQMERRNIQNGKIHIENIKIESECEIKVMNPFAISSAKNEVEFFLNKGETDRIYLSPELYKNLSVGESKYNNKSDVWTLGMILVETGIFEDMNNCYEQNERKIYVNKIQEKIEKVGERYGSEIKNVLKSMLAWEEEDRPSFIELKESFQSKKATIITTQPTPRNSPEVFLYNENHPQTSTTPPAPTLQQRPIETLVPHPQGLPPLPRRVVSQQKENVPMNINSHGPLPPQNPPHRNLTPPIQRNLSLSQSKKGLPNVDGIGLRNRPISQNGIILQNGTMAQNGYQIPHQRYMSQNNIILGQNVQIPENRSIKVSQNIYVQENPNIPINTILQNRPPSHSRTRELSRYEKFILEKKRQSTAQSQISTSHMNITLSNQPNIQKIESITYEESRGFLTRGQIPCISSINGNFTNSISNGSYGQFVNQGTVRAINENVIVQQNYSSNNVNYGNNVLGFNVPLNNVENIHNIPLPHFYNSVPQVSATMASMTVTTSQNNISEKLQTSENGFPEKCQNFPEKHNFLPQKAQNSPYQDYISEKSEEIELSFSGEDGQGSQNSQWKSNTIQGKEGNIQIQGKEKNIEIQRNKEEYVRNNVNENKNDEIKYSHQQKESEEVLEYTIEQFSVGSRYEGFKLGTMRHGKGKFWYQDGGMYDGHWHHNKMQGEGTLYYEDEKIAYRGTWFNDQFEGKGELFNDQPEEFSEPFNYKNFNEVGEKWVKYEGNFHNDEKCGRGKLVLCNGEEYVGGFEGDMVSGRGKFFRKNGEVVKGVWENNLLVQVE